MVDFKDMSREQLAEATQNYPWFASAWAQLCVMSASEGGAEAAESLYREARSYVPDAAELAGRLHVYSQKNYSDASLAAAIRKTISQQTGRVVPGMDYFSRDDYDTERSENDANISRIAVVDYSQPVPEPLAHEDLLDEVISETLARIYADQGYPERAKDIYIKLSLLCPEKNAYFASLIENLNS
ncbi:MAG: hypothetical protein MJY92_04885 [Bacteroidales bacterium]|nr:hypothetical protein [Bacteroidales bacterium]